MLNSLIISQQQQSQQQQQQVSAAAAGTLEQLIRAAKLMEQRAVANNLLLAASSSIGAGVIGSVPSTATTNTIPFPITKLGEDYQERMLASKIRGVFADPNASIVSSSTYPAPNSTGSSRRSSPISAASSAPHSPDSTNNHLLAMSAVQMPTTSAAHHHQQQHSVATAAANIVRASSSASSSAQSNNGGTTANANCGGRRVSGSRQSRAAHNELEKNRRANLRGHLEALKSVLPPESDSHRDTTLSLLTRARNHIRFIKEQKCGLAEKRAALLAEHLRLREMLQQGGPGNAIKIQTVKIAENQVEIENNKEEELPAPKPVFATNMILPAAATAQKNAIDIGNEEDEQQQTRNVQSVPLDVMENDDELEQNVASAKCLDLDFLALNGLLPALPLLYPYNSLTTTTVTMAGSAASVSPSATTTIGGQQQTSKILC